MFGIVATSTKVTASPVASTVQYTYSFVNWTNVPATVQGNITITANFTRVVNNDTVSIVTDPNDFGSVNKDSVVVPYGTKLTK